MHRTTAPGHVNNLFVAEDAAISRPPTELTPDWFNAVQEELATLVEGAGLVLDPANSKQVFAALKLLMLMKGGDTMKGPLLLKPGSASPFNANSCGIGFENDNDTGMFSGSDGTLQLASNGVEVLTTRPSGAIFFSKGVRVPKGAPGASDSSAISGYSFDEDGDTGLFAEGGSSSSSSDLLLRIDGLEVLRLQARSSPSFNDYLKLPNNRILQWCNISAPIYNTANQIQITNFNWPITFPNECLSVAHSLNSGLLSSYVNHDIEEVSKTGAKFKFVSGGTGVSASASVIAIGW